VVTSTLVSVMMKITIIHAKDGMSGLFVVIKPQDKNTDQFSRSYIYIYIYIYIRGLEL